MTKKEVFGFSVQAIFLHWLMLKFDRSYYSVRLKINIVLGTTGYVFEVMKLGQY